MCCAWTSNELRRLPLNHVCTTHDNKNSFCFVSVSRFTIRLGFTDARRETIKCGHTLGIPSLCSNISFGFFSIQETERGQECKQEREMRRSCEKKWIESERCCRDLQMYSKGMTMQGKGQEKKKVSTLIHQEIACFIGMWLHQPTGGDALILKARFTFEKRCPSPVVSAFLFCAVKLQRKSWSTCKILSGHIHL